MGAEKWTTNSAAGAPGLFGDPFEGDKFDSVGGVLAPSVGETVCADSGLTTSRQPRARRNPRRWPWLPGLALRNPRAARVSELVAPMPSAALSLGVLDLAALFLLPAVRSEGSGWRARGEGTQYPNAGRGARFPARNLAPDSADCCRLQATRRRGSKKKGMRAGPRRRLRRPPVSVLRHFSWLREDLTLPSPPRFPILNYGP